MSFYSKKNALISNKAKSICKFIMKDILARYGCLDRIRAKREELKANKAIAFFKNFHIRLKLTLAYNLKGNDKNMRGHKPIMNALVKACKGKISLWPYYLLFALMVSRLTCSLMTRYVVAKLINR
jgi:hypothetical protein